MKMETINLILFAVFFVAGFGTCMVALPAFITSEMLNEFKKGFDAGWESCKRHYKIGGAQ